MADNKCCPYSFYVPVKDKALNDFIEAQSNLSMSIRLLLKAFLGNYEKEYPDITTMDLRELIDNMNIDNKSAIISEQERKTTKTLKTNEKTNSETEQIIDISPSDNTEAEDQDEKINEMSDNQDNNVAENNSDDIVENNPDNTAENNPDDTVENNIAEDKSDDESDNKSDDEFGNKSDDEDKLDDAGQNNAEEVVPVITIEPEKPHKLANSSRDVYNKAQNANEPSSIDDIMSLMGE